MYQNGIIIRTRKLTAREVKNKLRNFIDELSEGCGKDVEEQAEKLKQHGDDFVDALTGEGDGGASYRRRAWHREGDGGAYMRDGGANYRNEGSWQEREELRKRNERKLQEMEQEMHELKARMRDGY